ncbi:MAG: hypothetical protein ACREVK_12745 [Gammaproteobacteria bacterium]
MKTSDKYHKWVEWSGEDQAYLGKCPDLITGIHGDDPIQLWWRMLLSILNLKVVLFLHREFDRCKKWRAVNTNSVRQKAALVTFPR